MSNVTFSGYLLWRNARDAFFSSEQYNSLKLRHKKSIPLDFRLIWKKIYQNVLCVYHTIYFTHRWGIYNICLFYETLAYFFKYFYIVRCYNLCQVSWWNFRTLFIFMILWRMNLDSILRSYVGGELSKWSLLLYRKRT